MKKIIQPSAWIALLFLTVSVGVTAFNKKPTATVKQLKSSQSQQLNKKTGINLVMSDEFAVSYSNYEDCSYIHTTPGVWPNETFYWAGNVYDITVGTVLYYDADLLYPASAGSYFYYHNETAEFHLFYVDGYGEVFFTTPCY